MAQGAARTSEHNKVILNKLMSKNNSKHKINFKGRA